MADSCINLTSESKSFLEYAAKVGLPDLSKPLEIIRESNEQAAVKLRGDYIFNGTTEECVAPSSEHQVPVTVLRPKTLGETVKHILIYFHGGGWVWSNRNTHMKFCEIISQEADCVVVNVEYRLSPEHKFPACYVDAEAVARWCLDNKKNLAENDSALVGVAGDSAGANISASVCHLVKGLDFQVLIYASLDLAARTEYPSYEKYCEGYILNAELMTWFMDQFLNSAEDVQNPIGFPMRRESFHGLPPALFIVSEIDPLADQSTAYNKKLEEANVKTKLTTLEGTIHGFVSRPGHFKETVRRTVQLISEYLLQL